jgi:hypothetical protein
VRLYENGQQMECVTYHKGRQQGIYRSWWSNGVLCCQGEGELWVHYHRNGTHASVYDGTQEWIFFRSGELRTYTIWLAEPGETWKTGRSQYFTQYGEEVAEEEPEESDADERDDEAQWSSSSSDEEEE